MKPPVDSGLVGEVKGSRNSQFSTRSLAFDPNLEEPRSITVEWEGGQGWRLRRLSRGNEPAPLPGRDHILTAQQIREGDPLKIIIIVANQHSGLFSCHNWLRYGKHSLKTLSVNLSDVQDAGNNPDERLSALAERIRSQAVEPKADSQPIYGEEDPIKLVRGLPEWRPRPEAIAFRNFDALDNQTAERLFGRLRALYEDSIQARALPSLVLLGHSTAPLDPEEKGPVSSLLKLAECYTLSSLQEPEVQQMAERFDRKVAGKKTSVQHIMAWTGGHPLLVQALFQTLQTDPDIRSIENATRFIERERLPAFDVWVQRLRESLPQPEISRIVDVLLRRKRFLRSPFEHRTSVLELLVQGWIRLDTEENAWVFRSECHRMLAAEAFGQRG